MFYWLKEDGAVRFGEGCVVGCGTRGVGGVGLGGVGYGTRSVPTTFCCGARSVATAFCYGTRSVPTTLASILLGLLFVGQSIDS